jgi:hypothetical protein
MYTEQGRRIPEKKQNPETKDFLDTVHRDIARFSEGSIPVDEKLMEPVPPWKRLKDLKRKAFEIEQEQQNVPIYSDNIINVEQAITKSLGDVKKKLKLARETRGSLKSLEKDLQESVTEAIFKAFQSGLNFGKK